MPIKMPHVDRWKGNYSALAHDVSRVVLWFPMARISNQEQLGLSEAGDWVIHGPDNLVTILPETIYIPFLPILENERDSFLRMVNEGLKEIDLKADALAVLPIREIILCAFHTKRSYWVDLGISWLTEIDGEIKKELRDVASSRWASQKLRQKAKKLADSAHVSER